RYAGALARLRLVRPFDAAPADAKTAVATTVDTTTQPNEVSTPARVDAAWLASLHELGLDPGPAASREHLLRRLTVDLANRTPTEEEAQRALAGPGSAVTSQVRAQFISELVDSARFRDMLARLLCDVFSLDPGSAASDIQRSEKLAQRKQLFARIDALRTLDDLARDILEGPLARVVDSMPDPRDRADFVAETLLGTSLACARCHDHPIGPWRQDEHAGFSACFVDEDRGSGRLYGPDQEPIEAQLLPLREKQAPAEDQSLRASLVHFLRGEGRESLARLWCHRVFARLFGRGLHDRNDDQRLTNPALHEAVLDVLTSDLLANGGRLDRPFRVLAATRLYALASADEAEFPVEVRYLARRAVRVLSAEQRLLVAATALDASPPPAIGARAPLSFELDVRRAVLAPLATERGNWIDVQL
ncbi:MAG TPA: DUF1549 domain-containing protein, partial [Planctomycetota bacterium]|nr:DUF1549 domain-containing protein [Planctomycetota bacterium]